MIKRLTILAALAAVLAVPSLASAHTGSVACTTKGVTFSYNANFAHDTTVTENVNGTTKSFLVHANIASSDTITSPSVNVIAGASWSDGNQAGSIPFVSLTGCTLPQDDCASPRPAGSGTCQPTVCVPTIQYVDVPGPATTTYVNVPGAIQYVDRWHTPKTIFKTRKPKTRIVYRFIKYTPVKQPKNVRHSGGVTG